ncbi:MAG: response regulator transcription factor [Gammaproteobacteria bacterium]|nr:response regulator transcription factor [Gammaproteobacteria bacterium]MYD77197.1 response regulator transcription factor [Gammaproteobacteria bacterium]MYJ51667.1 response regulator transcription factor [Gammaproteobacteria bacterium]
MRILLVEDEKDLGLQLTAKLEEHGYIVDNAVDGEEGLFFGLEYPVDMAIIDVGLPKLNGFELTKRLRANGKSYPILILTGRSHWRQKVEGLESGADDYLTKPFYFEELKARIDAHVRRAAGHASSVLTNGSIELDTVSQDVYVGKQKLELTAYEYLLLQHMMLNIGKVMSKMELSDQLYHGDDDPDSNVIEVLVGRLRGKLDPDNRDRFIRTLRGRGYRFVQDPR